VSRGPTPSPARAPGPLADAPPPYDVVVFDCDSTLSRIEGIEELAGGRIPELERLTAAAMDGREPLEAVYGRRLELVRPTRADVERVGRRYVEELVPHARELVAALHDLGKAVAVVSGGLLPPVLTLARELGIPADRVHAVDLEFDAEGRYAGFEADSPLARAGGKLDVVAAIGRRAGSERIALVGDGATDLEAAPAVARFVAFGGVVRRAAVHDAARVSCSRPDLAALLGVLATDEERERLAASDEHRRLVHAAARPV